MNKQLVNFYLSRIGKRKFDHVIESTYYFMLNMAGTLRNNPEHY